ncbi:MAG TPA: ribosome-associated translation inhibitor RaiA [Rhodospirillaceae bacterium]|nr:ribosome-associated translation inhibitor RaiA [Rhodospirillaceae bacterium]
MQNPLQISFHGIDHSDAVEQRIREKAAKLDQIFDRITSCRVVIGLHHRNKSNLHRKGEPYHISIDVTVPNAELVVKRDPQDPHINEDISVAVNDAFTKMESQLKDYVNRMRGDGKRPAAQ